MKTQFIRNILKEWKCEAGIEKITDSKCFYFYRPEGTIVITTTNPGLFIGYKGTLIDKYRDILSKSFEHKELNEHETPIRIEFREFGTEF